MSAPSTVATAGSRLSTTRVHLLLQVDPGSAERAAAFVRGVRDVRDAVVTTGAYDVIATVETPHEEDLPATLARVRRAPGLCALRLCRGVA